MKTLAALALATASFSLIGCATPAVQDQAAGKNSALAADAGKVSPTEESQAAYEADIDKFSDGQAAYSGFYNAFEYRATLLNVPVRQALLRRQSRQYQWDREKYLSEKDRLDKESAAQTSVFLSFYTPDRENDNLGGAKAIWRVYLDVGGQRYEGKAKKWKALLVEIQTLYPYHTRWNSAYMVTFPIATSAVETQASTITITGPLGTKTVRFAAVP